MLKNRDLKLVCNQIKSTIKSCIGFCLKFKFSFVMDNNILTEKNNIIDTLQKEISEKDNTIEFLRNDVLNLQKILLKNNNSFYYYENAFNELTEEHELIIRDEHVQNSDNLIYYDNLIIPKEQIQIFQNYNYDDSNLLNGSYIYNYEPQSDCTTSTQHDSNYFHGPNEKLVQIPNERTTYDLQDEQAHNVINLQIKKLVYPMNLSKKERNAISSKNYSVRFRKSFATLKELIANDQSISKSKLLILGKFKFI